MTSKYLTIPVVAGALGLGSIVVAQAAEPTTAELMSQIQALQTKVQSLETNQQQAVTKADVDATVESVLKDADKQSQLMQMEGFTAGWSNGHFVLGSADGNFKLMPMVQFQFRNVTNWRSNGKASGNDDIQNGFEIARAKLELAGNAFTPDLTYNFRWASGENNGGSSLVLENAYVQYKFADNLSFRAGQFKDNVFHEENVSSKRQLAVDRSLANELLGGGQTDYVQGASLIWDDGGAFRGEVGYHDGYNSDNTSFVDSGGNGLVGITPTNWGVSGRVEYAIQGNYKGYDQFTSNGNKDDLLVVGAGIDFSQGSSNDVLFHTVDLQWNPQSVAGLSVYAAYLGTWRDFNDATDNSFYDWGFVAQAGYMFNSQWEGFGRVDMTKFDNDALPSGVEDKLWEITAGVNYYLQAAPWHHNAKVTVDVSWLPNGSNSDQSQIGVLANNSGDDEFVIRGQFQLLL